MERISDPRAQRRRATVHNPTRPNLECSSSPQSTTRPTLHRSHSLSRTLTRVDDWTPPSRNNVAFADTARPACDVSRTARPPFPSSAAFEDSATETTENSGALSEPQSPPPSKPSVRNVLRVLIIDLCVCVKDKCRGSQAVQEVYHPNASPKPSV
ncbi:hypothetical protein BV20DRAFT_961127 [Pilatotrama ljubarskyi]|nr:hypothetical protein BV20DRAFT_961127 [Pilatotrama ljubarskyi]